MDAFRCYESCGRYVTVSKSRRQTPSRKACLTAHPWHTIASMHFGIAELLIGSMAVLLLCSDRIILLFSGRTLQEILGTRTLTFERTADIFAGLGIVAAWLMTFLYLSHR